ncbi:thiamine pyrophosphokinase [Astrocystis sublimbata]|nr:thiamine pyrophosphokinase [Astrocystis sublimbata]
MDPPTTAPDSDVIEWYPVRQLLGYPGHEFTLITLNVPIRDPALFEDLWNAAKSKIAADGGANRIHDLIKQQASRENKHTDDSSSESFEDLSAIIGDLDSLTEAARDYFSPHTHIIYNPDQYSTDFAKAVHLVRATEKEEEEKIQALPQYPRTIICHGGLGGRVDQGLSQLHHLYLFQQSASYAEGRIFLVSGDSLSFVLKGGKRHRIRVRETQTSHIQNQAQEQEKEGEQKHDEESKHKHNQARKYKYDLKKLSPTAPFAKHAGIVPVGAPAVISLKGFEWDVTDWPTAFGAQMSTSNHVLPESDIVEVETDRDVLFTIALKKGED